MAEDTDVENDEGDAQLENVVAYCTRVEDFYAPNARDMVGKILAGFLNQSVLTPGELLYSYKALKRLNYSGRPLNSAVDRVGTRQAKARGGNPVARVRELGALVTTAVQQAFEKDRANPLPTITVETFLTVIKGIVGTPEHCAEEINRVIAEHLSAFRTWSDKVREILCFIESLEGSEAEQQRFKILLMEALRNESAWSQLLGFAETLEERCSDYIELWQGIWKHREGTSEDLIKICSMIADGKGEEFKGSIEYMLMQALVDKDPLRSPEPEIEVQAQFDLFRRMWINGRLLGGAKALSLLERRQSRIINNEGVTDLLYERRVLVERLAFLIVLAGQCIGRAPRAIMKTFFHSYFGSDDFVAKLLLGQEPHLGKMQTLTTIHRGLKSCWLEEAEKIDYMAKVEAAQLEIMKRSQILGQIEKRSSGPAQKVISLLDLYRKGTFIDGTPLSVVKQMLNMALAQPQFATEYLGAAQGEDRAKRAMALGRMLGMLGINWKPAGS